jgi:hypothetical protein
VVRVLAEPGITNRRAIVLEALGERQRTFAVGRHPQRQVRDAQADVRCHLRIHGGAEQHERALVQIHQRLDEFLRAAHGTGDNVGHAADELRDAVHHDIRAVIDRAQNEGAEGIVDHEGNAGVMRDRRELRDVRSAQRRVRQALRVDGARPVGDGSTHGVEIGNVDEGRRYARLRRQEIVHQRIGAAVHGIRCDDVIARTAEREQRRGNRAHAARGAVRGFGALDRRELQAEVVHGGVEMPPIQVATGIVTFQPLEQGRHRAGLHDRERRARLDGHVDAAVLAKLVAQAGQRFDGITARHCVAPDC